MSTKILRVVVPVLLATMLLGRSAFAGLPGVPAEWSMYQARSDHNAVFARAGFRRAWRFDAKSRINSGLAVVADRIYFDTLDGDVLALDARTGALRWRTRLDNVTMSTPIVAGGAVYVGTGHNGPLGMHSSDFVYAVDARASALPMWGRPEGDHIVALDAVTGTKRWSYRTAGEDMPSPVLVNGALVFANGDFNAYAIHAKDGAPLWQHDVSGLATMASSNRFGDDAIISICSGKDYVGSTLALDSSTGSVRWRAPAGDCDAAPTVAADRVFVSGIDGNRMAFGYGARGTVRALDAKRGTVAWRYMTRDAGPFTKIGSNERAIAGCYGGGSYYQSFPTVNLFVAFDARDGRVRWQLRTTGPVKMSAVVKNGRVYFGDTVGVFYSVDAATGSIVRAQAFDAPFTVSPPVIVGDTVFAVAGTQVFAFQP